MYQFRFSGNESIITGIFEEPELSKAFEEAFMKIYESLINRIRQYSSFVLSKKDFPDYDPSSFSIVLTEEELIENFKNDLKRHLLYDAMNDVFSSKLDVKENILEKLNESFIEQYIMGRKLLYTFNDAIVDSNDSSVGLSDEVLEELQSEFLQK